jgi:hypothetical protein
MPIELNKKKSSEDGFGKKSWMIPIIPIPGTQAELEFRMSPISNEIIHQDLTLRRHKYYKSFFIIREIVFSNNRICRRVYPYA